jgi:hypothetical protein
MTVSMNLNKKILVWVSYLLPYKFHFEGTLLHIKITHFNDDLFSSLQVSQVFHFGHKCHKHHKQHTIILPMSCLEQRHKEHFKDTIKDWFKKDKSSYEEYKYFTMEKTTQKSFLKASAPLPIVR